MNLIAMTIPYVMLQMLQSVVKVVMVFDNPWLLNIHKLTVAHFCLGEGSVSLLQCQWLSDVPSGTVSCHCLLCYTIILNGFVPLQKGQINLKFFP